jgi:hypothetical protein
MIQILDVDKAKPVGGSGYAEFQTKIQSLTIRLWTSNGFSGLSTFASARWNFEVGAVKGAYEHRWADSII